MVHLAWLGREGFRELGELLVRRTAYARERLAAVDGVELLHEAPVVARVRGRGSTRRSTRCSTAVAERGIAAGYPLGREYPEYEDGLLVAITERRTKAQIDGLAEALGAADRRRAWRACRRQRSKAPRARRPPDGARPRPRCSANAR